MLRQTDSPAGAEGAVWRGSHRQGRDSAGPSHFGFDWGDELLVPPACFASDFKRAMRWRGAIRKCGGWTV